MISRYFHSARLAMLAAAFALSICANAGVMNWQLSNTTGEGTAKTVMAQFKSDYGVDLTHARLVAVAPDNTGNKYNLLEQVVGGQSTGNYTYHLDDVFSTAGVVSDLGSYAGAGWAYFVELGYFSGNDYEIASRSAAVNYNDIASYISAGQLLPTTGMYAFGSFTVVPEPASAILMMIGIGLLGLRRKRA